MEKQSRKYRRYDVEFKTNAVSMVLDEELSVAYVSRELSIPEPTLRDWVAKFQKGKDIRFGKTVVKIPENIEQENLRLRRENRELKMEREILKKAAAFFAKENV